MPSRQNRHPGLTFSAACAAFLMGYFPTFVAPWLIDAMATDLGYSASAGGMLLSIEFVAIALTGIMVAPFLGAMPLHKLAIYGALLALLGHLTSAWIEGFTLLALIRFVAGVGAGLAIAAGGATIAVMQNPDRNYGLLLVAMGVTSALAQFVSGYISQHFGYRGLYLELAGFVLLALAIIPWLSMTPQRPSSQMPRTHLPRKGLGLAAILVVVIFVATQMGAWTLLGSLSKKLEISIWHTSVILGAGQISGLLGGALAAWINIRFGRTVPSVTGLVLNATSIYVLYASWGVSTYILAFFIFNVMWYFCMPYLLGAAAALDTQGRWAAAAASSSLFGIALGPICFGAVYDFAGFSMVGFLGLTLTLISLFLLVLVLRCLETADFP